MSHNPLPALKVVEIPINSIQPAAYNPRRIDEAALAGLMESLKKFGMPSPLVINRRSGVLVSGHQRLKAATALGWETVPAVEVDLSPAEEKALNVTLNNRHIGGDFTAGLAQVLDDVRLEMGDEFMASLRLDDIEIPQIELVEDGDNVDPPTPALPIEPKSKLGDLWTLGKHRLLCGDSTNIQHVERLMDGRKADMVFTDPPYGVNFQSNMRTESEKFDVLKNDDTFLTEWIGLLPSVSAGWVFIWTTWKVLAKWFEITAPIGELSNLVVWDKGGGGIGDLSKTFLTDHELSLVFHRGAELTGKRIGSVWSVGKDGSASYLHPTQKPVALAEMAMGSCTHAGNVVLDLFGGSGSTLIACERMKRQARLMELDPKYCDVILQRWAEFAKADPVRDDGVKWSELQAGAAPEPKYVFAV